MFTFIKGRVRNFLEKYFSFLISYYIMVDKVVKESKEFKFGVNADFKLENGKLEGSILVSEFTGYLKKLTVLSLDDLRKISSALDFFVDNEDNKNLKVSNLRVSGDKLVFNLENKFRLKSLKAEKKKIVLKARVPAPNTVKSLGAVKYSDKNPFTFPVYIALPPARTPTANGTKSLVNKGAIYWYTATNTINNTLLKIKRIMINSPATSFIPNPTTNLVSLTGTDIYFGFDNTNKDGTVTNPAYTDFYVYQPTFNNYLYVFTVKNSEFFTNARFPKSKNVAIP